MNVTRAAFHLRDRHVHLALHLDLLHARRAHHLIDDLLVLDLVALALREQVLLAARVVAHDGLELLSSLVL